MTVIKLQIINYLSISIWLRFCMYINYMRLSPTNGISMNKGHQNQKYKDGKTFWRQCMNNPKKKKKMGQ